MREVEADAGTRRLATEEALRAAFEKFIEKRPLEVIVFSRLSVIDLASAISEQPIILKPLLSACNIAARAIERDLQIKNLNTYAPTLKKDYAAAIAGYLKPFLPPYLALSALSYLDRVGFIDKEIRKNKGRWEKNILRALNRYSEGVFKKRKFEVDGLQFELDAATPENGEILCGIDVKRIEARRDIHKRCDEVVNKAAKLKKASPGSKFAAVIYYPFIDEHINVQDRLHSDNIDAIAFATESEELINTAVRLLLSKLGQSKTDT